MRYLLDTNAVINYLNAALPIEGMQLLSTIVDDESIISVITKMEALGFNFTSLSEQTAIEIFINSSNTIELNNDIINKTIDLRKTIKLKLPDAIIAATALTLGLELITRNTKDFEKIVGLKTVNPFNF